VPAQDHGLRHHRKFRARNAESGPYGVGRQQVSHEQHRFGGRGRSPRNSQAQLKQRGIRKKALVDELAREAHVADIEHLQLGLRPRGADQFRHAPEMRRDIHERVVAEIHGRNIEAARIGLELQHVFDPLLGHRHGAFGRRAPGILARRDRHASSTARIPASS